MIKTFAVLVTRENLDDIVAEVAKWNLDISDELPSSFDEAIHFEECIYAVFSLNYDFKHATFITMWSADFAKSWYFNYGQKHGPHFREVELINPKPS